MLVNYVVTIVVENCLIREIPKLFTLEMVQKMDKNEISKLAEEDAETTAERRRYSLRRSEIVATLGLCRRFKGGETIRKSSRPSTATRRSELC